MNCKRLPNGKKEVDIYRFTQYENCMSYASNSRTTGRKFVIQKFFYIIDDRESFKPRYATHEIYR
jgi:hypothetical protein